MKSYGKALQCPTLFDPHTVYGWCMDNGTMD